MKRVTGVAISSGAWDPAGVWDFYTLALCGWGDRRCRAGIASRMGRDVWVRGISKLALCGWGGPPGRGQSGSGPRACTHNRVVARGRAVARRTRVVALRLRGWECAVAIRLPPEVAALSGGYAPRINRWTT